MAAMTRAHAPTGARRTPAVNRNRATGPPTAPRAAMMGGFVHGGCSLSFRSSLRRAPLPFPFPSRAAARIDRRVFGCAALMAPLAALASGPASSAPGAVDAARLQAADSEPQNWFTGGRDKDGTYYSPLKLIDAKNVKDFGFA